MGKSFFLRYNLLLFLLIVILFIYFSDISVKDVIAVLLKLNPLQIFILIGVYIAISINTILGKKYLLQFLGYKVGSKNISIIHFASLSAHYSTPAKIGYPLTVYLLNKLEGIPVSISSASILIELIVSILLTGTVGLVGSAVYLKAKIESFTNGLIFIVIALFLLGMTALWVFEKSNKGKAILGDMKAALERLNVINASIYIISQAGIQLLNSVYLILVAFYLGVKLDLWHALVINSSAFFIGAISMIPMGLGTRDLSMVYYLKYFGIATQVSLSIASITRVISTGIGYIIGLLAIGYLGLQNIEGNRIERHE